MINNKDKIDDLFREGLEGYLAEPSAGTWEKLQDTFFGRSAGRRGLFLAAILLFLLAGSAFVAVLLLPEHRPGPVVESTPAVMGADENEMTSHPSEMTSPVSETEDMISTKSTDIENIEPISEVSKVTLQDPGSAPVEMSSRPITYPSSAADEAKRMVVKVSMMTGMKADLQGSILLSPPFTAPTEKEIGMPIYKGLRDEYARKYELSAGMNAMPTMIFYDPNPNNTGWSAAVEADYDRSRFHVYAGAGVSRLKDKGSWEIRYESYDSVGYYMNISSFRVNPESPGEVIFEMTEETVYDSVPHIVVTEEVNRYTYLDIPVGIGFTVFENRRFGLTVKTGVTFSWLTGRDEPTADLSITGADDIYIQRLVPERTNTAWRFSAGLEASCLLTGRWSIYMQPTYEQYLNPVYSSGNDYQSSRPYFIGLKAGARFRIR